MKTIFYHVLHVQQHCNACACEMQEINSCKRTINFNVIFFVHIKKVSIRAPESGHHGNSACHAQ